MFLLVRFQNELFKDILKKINIDIAFSFAAAPPAVEALRLRTGRLGVEL